ncbi:MAG: alpha/beta hydrolase [Ruminiclostridium sp.]|nr:alpha/beta hydrolase [Ruminiclostridium sp.]
MSRKKKLLLGGSGILLVLTAACLIYLTTGSYPANEDAVTALASAETYTVTEYDDGTTAFVPLEPKAGLIFYPGGKVEAEAYASLMAAFAREDILCILLDLPFDLAVFDVTAADGIQEQYPEIQRWYLSGHSLGGAMAASYASKHADKYDGLFLLAAYSTEDLTDSALKIVSLYGSEDLVLNREKYGEYRGNLPKDTLEQVIEGGSHAYFGSYGFQDGDGTPTISNQEQIETTVQLCLSVMEQE